MVREYTHGWTNPEEFVLKADKAAVLIQGLTVALILKDKDGTVVDTAGKTDNLDDGTAGNKGKVRYSPAAADLDSTKSPYTARWKVTDGAGKVAFFPNGEADQYRVYPQ